MSFAEAIALLQSGAVHNNDFKHLWLGSRILAEGGNPDDAEIMLLGAKQYGFESINPFVYLPATGLILRPFSVLPFTAADTLWFWFNWILAWLCVAFGPRLLRVERPWLAQIAGAAFLIGAMPFYRQMTAGQMNVVVLASIILALALLIQQRESFAGILLGFAAAFKIAPILLLFILIGMRRWKAAISGLLTLLLFSIAADVWTGHEAIKEFLPLLRDMGYGRSTWAQFENDFYRDPYNHSLNSLFHHLFTENPHTAPWLNLGPIAANGITYVVSILLLLAMASVILKYRRRPYFQLDWAEAETSLFLLGVSLMLLLPSLMWDHYAVQALAAIMWLFGSRTLPARPIPLTSTLVAFLLLSYPLASQAKEWSQGFGILIMPIRLWGVLALTALLYAAWQEKLNSRLQI